MKAVRKLGMVLVLAGMGVLASSQQPAFGQKQPTGGTTCPDGTFKCYCNNNFVGCLTTVQYCWNACG